jgi:hypothetical protein
MDADRLQRVRAVTSSLTALALVAFVYWLARAGMNLLDPLETLAFGKIDRGFLLLILRVPLGFLVGPPFIVLGLLQLLIPIALPILSMALILRQVERPTWPLIAMPTFLCVSAFWAVLPLLTVGTAIGGYRDAYFWINATVTLVGSGIVRRRPTGTREG